MSVSFKRHRFPPEVIRYAVWLYFRSTLSIRDVEELLAERGIEVSREAVRMWAIKFGPQFARNLRLRQPRPTGRWHIDEMVVKIAGERRWLWRAVDDEGVVLDMLVQRRRSVAELTCQFPAAIYGNEDGVNDAIARGHVFLTTKLWNAGQGYDSALRAFDTSCKKLKRDVAELYLIHWASPARGKYVESWEALTRLKEEGRAPSIGVSNFAESHLKEFIDATGVIPAVNQIELYPDFQQHKMRQVDDGLKIKTKSWSPLGQAKALDNNELRRIGEKHGKSPAQVVIRWHLDSGLIVIPKLVHPERIRQNIDVFDFELDADDMNAMTKLDRENGRIGGDPITANY